jgi:hypothetical protein
VGTFGIPKWGGNMSLVPTATKLSRGRADLVSCEARKRRSRGKKSKDEVGFLLMLLFQIFKLF